MFRKSIFAVAAVATIAAASLLPTEASAGWKGHHHRWGLGLGLGFALAAPLAYGYAYNNYNCVGYVQMPSGYMKKVLVPCY